MSVFAFVGSSTPVDAQSLAAAPPSNYFVNVNVLFQPGDQSFADPATFPVHGETATVGSQYDVEGGAGFDIGGGAYIWNNIGVGLTFSRIGGGDRATTTASLPHPILYNAPRSAEITANHAERAIHLQALWTLPVSERFGVTVAAGPSFYTVTRDRLTAVSFDEGSEPYDTVTVTGATVDKQSEGGVGVNIGVDGTYMVTDRVGAGVMLRYASASVDFAGADGTVDVDAGGVQVGFGVRVRF